MSMKWIAAGCVVLAAIAFVAFKIEMRDKQARLRDKAANVQTGVRSWLQQGKDASSVLTVIDQVKPALDAGDSNRAEVLLDRAIVTLRSDSKRQQDQSPLPVYSVREESSNLYLAPQPVAIEGYTGSAMEPFISPDGHYLFFNNENDPNTNTNLHFAERTGKLSFHYLGELPGANSQALDAVPSLDVAGHFYFTTLRDYDRTLNSVYTGIFDGKSVRNIHPVSGKISPKLPGSVNMDVAISPNGQTLYISRAVISTGAPAPKQSDILIACLKDGSFGMDDSARIMKNVNTAALEYAPAIAANGLELYFTRASQPAPDPQAAGAQVRIMLATRMSIREPFDQARVLSSLSGFVEAPSISMDTTEMFFHKKASKGFRIYRAVRNLR